MAEKRVPSEYYSKLAASLIQEDPDLVHIRDSEVTICYLESDVEKKSAGKYILGECEKVPAKWKWAVPCDFTITIFSPNVERLTKDQERILMLHELLHVGIEKDGNEEVYSVIPHDIEDFKAIIDRYGIDWSE